MKAKRYVTTLALSGLAAWMVPALAVEFSSPTRNVENPDKFPYAETVSFTIPAGDHSATRSFPAPVGKRYFIEYVTAACSIANRQSTDTFPQVMINVAKTGGTPSFFSVPALDLQYKGMLLSGRYYAGSNTVNIISDGGTPGLSVTIANDYKFPASNDEANCEVSVFGHTLAN